MVKIITDTTSCLPANIQSRFKIPVVPQTIHFGEESYQENKDIDIDMFMTLLSQSRDLPKTAAPSPELFIELFTSHTDHSKPILCIHPSSDLSGTVRSAETAKSDFPDLDIHVIDTRLVASPLGFLVHQAAIMAEEKRSIQEIISKLKYLSNRCRIYFLVATLDYLARGGRIGGASALLGNVLQLKPILSLERGRVEPLLKERTFSRALDTLKSLIIKEYPSGKDGFLSIMHAGEPELANDLASFFKGKLPIKELLISSLPPAIITHAGPGSIAVGFFSD
jgi:DegV family protein with EDD domain